MAADDDPDFQAAPISVWGAIIVAPLDYAASLRSQRSTQSARGRHKGRARAAWLVSLFIAVIDAEQ